MSHQLVAKLALVPILGLPRVLIMMKNVASVIGLTIALNPLSAADQPDKGFPPEAIVFFEKQVRPLLAEKCWDCHGDTKPKAKLRLTSRTDILKGGESGPAAVAGKPAESLLLKAVSYQLDDLQMPPKGKLTARQIEILDRWVRLGLPWPATSAAEAKPPMGSDAERGTSHWAFQPVKVAPVAGQDKGWAKTPIDHYILAGLENKELKPASPASKATLLRRVTFDLIGLPPTLAELDAFLQDDSPQAFAKVVERLLASPHYGERWGRHWLDLIRYADGYGRLENHAPSNFKEIWRYRDWVTTAFNEDLPYTEFIRLQLAGDLLHPDNPRRGAVATGLLAIALFDADTKDEQQHADVVDDMVDVVGRSILGMTISCARCHDHKFDPITAEDYYGLAGIFFNVRVTETLKPEPNRITIPIDTPAERELFKKFTKEKSDLEAEIAQLRKNIKAAKDKPMPELMAQLENRTQQLKQLLKQQPPPPPKAVVVKEGGHASSRYKTFQDAPVLIRGDPLKHGKIVPRGFPKALGGGLEKPVREGSGRLELVDWLTRPNHVLTARVMVNRIWHHHMGAGIVRTPNNFGLTGEPPTHPELLDFLADYFVRSGWSIKAMHRLILNSAVYQQSSLFSDQQTLAHDPDNRLWGRMDSRRLDAEALRDSLLALAGTLDRTIGGPGTEDLMTPRRTHYYMTKLRHCRSEQFQFHF